MAGPERGKRKSWLAARRRTHRRRWIAAVVVLLVLLGVGAALVLGGRDGSERAAPEREPLRFELANIETRDVAIEVGLTNPGEEPVSFTGSGTLAGQDRAAEVEYDLAEVPNAAGFWGHHDSLRVVYVGDVTLTRVMPTGPPWMEIEPGVAGPAVGADIARMREVVLANPVLLLSIAESGSLPYVRDRVYEGRVSLPEELSELADSFGTDSVLMRIETDDGTVESVAATWNFPVVRGAEDEVEVIIDLVLGDTSEATIDVPAASERQSLREMLDR